ncbi:MAG: response regulator transcription factor [Candidatus Izemoplasmatales bacterium]
MKYDVLVIEDDQSISRILDLELKHEGYTVCLTYSGKEALELFQKHEFSIILLDLMLPEVNGMEVCRKIRKTSNVPIIMLTARRDLTDKIVGLDIGADDYITKPFEMDELLARIRANIRKGSIRKNDDQTIKHKSLTINVLSRKCYVNEDLIELTKTEYTLLHYIITNKGIVLSRQQILDHVWGFDFYGDTNIIDVYIRYLRNKIDYKYHIDIIKTIRGVGFTTYD